MTSPSRTDRGGNFEQFDEEEMLKRAKEENRKLELKKKVTQRKENFQANYDLKLTREQHFNNVSEVIY